MKSTPVGEVRCWAGSPDNDEHPLTIKATATAIVTHLRQRQKVYRTPPPLVDADGMLRYRASKHDCDACALKLRCCPNASARKIPRSIHEGARQMARDICASEAGRTSRREREKVEMLFAHLKRILRLDRLRLRGPNGARDEVHLAAAAQNLRKLAKLIPLGQPSLA